VAATENFTFPSMRLRWRVRVSCCVSQGERGERGEGSHPRSARHFFDRPLAPGRERSDDVDARAGGGLEFLYHGGAF
jgi:hypothetical protein